MPERYSDKSIYSLLEITQHIQQTITEAYPATFWIRAEMNKLNFYGHSGHAYPALVEKQDGKIVAEVRSTIWSAQFRNINQQFQRVLGEPLKDGIKVLLLASIRFSPLYGMSLQIHDIDPSFTLGDLEREKQETIQRLKHEGRYEKNKLHTLALLPQRIAIISVETSKGYADFMNVIEGNDFGYAFFTMLFPALLQGDAAIPSILSQLERIERVKDHFDAVAIIRGGGGDVGLSCYNHYELARAIADFPLPVLTGIGHSTNETVSEMISFQNAITPTKLAEFLIQQFHLTAVPVMEAGEKIVQYTRQLLDEKEQSIQHEIRVLKNVGPQFLQMEKQLLHQWTNQFVHANHTFTLKSHQHLSLLKEKISFGVQQIGLEQRHRMQQMEGKLDQHTHQLLKDQNILLQQFEKTVALLSPAQLLKRGYSITLKDGKAVRSVDQIKSGDIITTQFADGTMTSTAIQTQKDDE